MIKLQISKEQFCNASYEELKNLCFALQENLAEIDAVAPTDETTRLTLEAYRILISDALELARITASHIKPSEITLTSHLMCQLPKV